MPRDSASPPHGVGLSKAQDQNQETVSLVLAGASPVLSAPTQGSVTKSGLQDTWETWVTPPPPPSPTIVT